MVIPMMLAKKIPWVRTVMVARWLFEHGRKRVEQNLDPNERKEMWGLMRQSKGQRANLTPSQQQRFIDLVKKAARGHT